MKIQKRKPKTLNKKKKERYKENNRFKFAPTVGVYRNNRHTFMKYKTNTTLRKKLPHEKEKITNSK